MQPLLVASGGSKEDADSFAASLRERIEQISRAGSGKWQT